MCQASNTASDLPLETPSHNGPYVGTAQVRELPFGFSGEALFKIIQPESRIRAGQVSRRRAIANSLKCHRCGQKVPRNSGTHKYCSKRCRNDVENEKAREKRLNKPRKTKWS